MKETAILLSLCVTVSRVQLCLHIISCNFSSRSTRFAIETSKVALQRAFVRTAFRANFHGFVFFFRPFSVNRAIRSRNKWIRVHGVGDCYREKRGFPFNSAMIRLIFGNFNDGIFYEIRYRIRERGQLSTQFDLGSSKRDRNKKSLSKAV